MRGGEGLLPIIVEGDGVDPTPAKQHRSVHIELHQRLVEPLEACAPAGHEEEIPREGPGHHNGALAKGLRRAAHRRARFTPAPPRVTGAQLARWLEAPAQLQASGAAKQRRDGSERVATLLNKVAAAYPHWNATSRRHLILMPCDHGPGDCMWQRTRAVFPGAPDAAHGPPGAPRRKPPPPPLLPPSSKSSLGAFTRHYSSPLWSQIAEF